jgi:hypothetical protein
VARRDLRSVLIGSLNPHILDSQNVVKGIYILALSESNNFTVFENNKLTTGYRSTKVNKKINRHEIFLLNKKMSRHVASNRPISFKILSLKK